MSGADCPSEPHRLSAGKDRRKERNEICIKALPASLITLYYLLIVFLTIKAAVYFLYIWSYLRFCVLDSPEFIFPSRLPSMQEFHCRGMDDF